MRGKVRADEQKRLFVQLKRHRDAALIANDAEQAGGNAGNAHVAQAARNGGANEDGDVDGLGGVNCHDNAEKEGAQKPAWSWKRP